MSDTLIAEVIDQLLEEMHQSSIDRSKKIYKEIDINELIYSLNDCISLLSKELIECMGEGTLERHAVLVISVLKEWCEKLKAGEYK